VLIVRPVWFSTLAAALVAGCGSGGESTVQSVNTLRFTRADGSRITFRGPVSVTCERANADEPPLLRVLVGRRTPEGRRPFWTLEIALADLQRNCGDAGAASTFTTESSDWRPRDVPFGTQRFSDSKLHLFPVYRQPERELEHHRATIPLPESRRRMRGGTDAGPRALSRRH
jgi:hypothetical protein